MLKSCKGPRLLLIDGNNLCHRVYWVHKTLAYHGNSTGLLFGFMRALVSLHKRWPEHFRIIAWEGGYERRLKESEAAVQSGLIPSAYKATRDREVTPELEDMLEQREQLREGLNLVRCLQVKTEGYEADDVIYSYALEARKWDGDAVIVSSDQDFFQAIGDNVTLYDAMKSETWTRERFVLEFGFEPGLWVDVGAIEGEVGTSKDNIHGVPGWGKVNARKYVRQYGGIDEIVAVIKAMEKRGKREQDLLDNEERMRVARSLKQMDVVPGLPKPRQCRALDKKDVEAWLLNFGLASLLKDAWRLV